MFQIKTDIRQFNCETQDKVEKLIRNWVIRPTDLVYHQDQKRWAPIGEHPDFEPLFTSMRQEDTEGKQTEMASESAEYDLEEIVQSVDSAALPLPEAPPGVEQPVHDGEVTTMTERTAQLLGMEDEASSASVEPSGVSSVIVDPSSMESEQPVSTGTIGSPDQVVVEKRSGRHNLPEELFLTNEVDREEVDLAAEEALLDELGEYEGLPTASELDAGWDSLMDMEDLRRTGEFDRDGSLPGAPLVSPSKAAPREEVTKVTEMQEVLESDRDRAGVSAGEAVVGEGSLGQEATAPADEAAEELRVVTASPVADDEDEKENRTGMINISDLLKVRDSAAASASGDADASKEIAAVVKTARTRAPNPHQDREFVSEGYALPMPIDIELSDQDRAHGLAFSAADEAEKDKRFPKPYPKKLNELIVREFSLERPAPLPSRSTPPPSSAAPARAARVVAPQPDAHEAGSAPAWSPERMRFVMVAMGIIGLLLLITIIIIFQATP